MASEVSLDGIKKAVFFPFRGKNWSDKVLIGAAINFANFIIPLIPMILLMGYFGKMMKRILLDDEDPALPEWNDWGTCFLDGFRMFGVFVVYTLPGALVAFFGYVLFFLVGFGINLLALASPNGNSTPLIPFDMGLGAAFFGMFGGMFVLWIGVFIFFVSMLFYEPAIGNCIAKGSFAAAFRFKEWWPVFKANLSGYLLVFTLMFGLSYALIILVQFFYLTIVLCILLPFAFGFAGFVIGGAGYSLYAIAYRDGVRKLAGTRLDQPGKQKAA